MGGEDGENLGKHGLLPLAAGETNKNDYYSECMRVKSSIVTCQKVGETGQ